MEVSKHWMRLTMDLSCPSRVCFPNMGRKGRVREKEQRQTLKRMKAENFPERTRDVNSPVFRKPTASQAGCIKRHGRFRAENPSQQEKRAWGWKASFSDPEPGTQDPEGHRMQGSERKQQPRNAPPTEMVEKWRSPLEQILRKLFQGRKKMSQVEGLTRRRRQQKRWEMPELRRRNITFISKN